MLSGLSENSTGNIGLCYFNSIKVQLERVMSTTSWARNQFQFHKGTIRTWILHRPRLDIADFNSIKVRLELVGDTAFRSFISYFNSIKVRLEHNEEMADMHLCLIFQFHKGTIRTQTLMWFSVWSIDFNSIKVRLEPSILGRGWWFGVDLRKLARNGLPISIP